jgi:hypothetical protein
MNIKLEQKRFFEKKRFELKKYEIEIYDKKVGEESEYSIDYLSLGVKTVKKSIKNSAFLEFFFWAFFILQFGLLIYALIFEADNKGMLIFWSLGSGFFLGFIFFLRWQPGKKLIYLTGGQQNIEFFQENPNTKEINEFIEELKIRIKDAYKNEYLKWDENSSKEHKIAQLEWLKRMKIIEEEEYDELVEQIELDSIIGFRKKAANDRK